MSLPCRCRKSTVHNVAKEEQDYTFATLGATILGVDSRCSLLIDRCLCLLSTVRPGRSLIMGSFVIVIFCSTLPLRQTLRMRFTSAPDERPGTCPTKGSPLRKELSMFCLSWQGRSVETGMILVLFSALFIWNLLVCCILFQGHHGNSFRCSAYTTLCRLHTSHVDYQGRQRWDRCTFLVKWFLIEWRTNFRFEGFAPTIPILNRRWTGVGKGLRNLSCLFPFCPVLVNHKPRQSERRRHMYH